VFTEVFSWDKNRNLRGAKETQVRKEIFLTLSDTIKRN
jgi:hypothetical protein